jgi:hypothetical protein
MSRTAERLGRTPTWRIALGVAILVPSLALVGLTVASASGTAITFGGADLASGVSPTTDNRCTRYSVSFTDDYDSSVLKPVTRSLVLSGFDASCNGRTLAVRVVTSTSTVDASGQVAGGVLTIALAPVDPSTITSVRVVS